jgi:hypothetical protein
MCSRWGLKRRRRRRNHCFVKKKSFIFLKKNIKKQFKHKTFIKIQKIIFTFMLHKIILLKKKRERKKKPKIHYQTKQLLLEETNGPRSIWRAINMEYLCYICLTNKNN